jgi:hypothetical protein
VWSVLARRINLSYYRRLYAKHRPKFIPLEGLDFSVSSFVRVRIFVFKSKVFVDWSYYFDTTNSDLAVQFRVRGDWPTRVWIESGLLRMRPELFHLGMFIGYFLAGWCLFHILKTLKFLGQQNRELITILFLVFPINSARVAMVNFAYCLSLLLFYFAWYLLVTKKSQFAHIASIVLFVLSFGATASLMVFLLVPICHVAYLKYLNPKSNGIREWWILALISILSPMYWYLDRRFNAPQGNYLDVYSIQRSGFIRAILLFGVGFLIVLWFRKFGKQESEFLIRYLLIAIGLLLLIIGATPYLLAGHLVDASAWMFNFVPRSSDWDSRHQLLLGLGFAVFVVGVIGESSSILTRHLRILFLGFCIVLNLAFMQGYFLDSLKQNEFITEIGNHKALADSKVVMIDDQAMRFNARGRGIRNYEWDAMLSVAYPQLHLHSIYLAYVDCKSGVIPDTLVTVRAGNSRLKATISRDVSLRLKVTHIDPCP